MTPQLCPRDRYEHEMHLLWFGGSDDTRAQGTVSRAYASQRSAGLSPAFEFPFRQPCSSCRCS